MNATIKTMVDFRILAATPDKLSLEVSGGEWPVKLDIISYERGVVVNVPWWAQEKLGGAPYEALRAVLRSHYSGAIGFRTETDPRFQHAANARANGKDRRQPELTEAA